MKFDKIIQKWEIAKTIKKRTKEVLGRLAVPRMKTYNKYELLNTMWYLCKKRNAAITAIKIPKGKPSHCIRKVRMV